MKLVGQENNDKQTDRDNSLRTYRSCEILRQCQTKIEIKISYNFNLKKDDIVCPDVPFRSMSIGVSRSTSY